MGVLPEAVLFDSEPVQVICLILVPSSDTTTSLKMMAQLSRKLADDTVRRQVLEADSSDELRRNFNRNEMRMEGPVCARDIMRLPRWSVGEETPISLCAHMMSRDQLRAIPVLDAQKRIVGQITSEKLFSYGLPAFFSKLKSVSFIAEFDPFEKYFADERQVLASEVMTSDANTVPLDYTIMEVVFDLAIRRLNKLYVVNEEGAWVGTIDQGTVLNNVINF
jgi:CBS-domain-containing membrane protein